jgi:hypothetical protein
MGAVSRARDVCAAERTLDTAPIFHRMSLESEGKKTLKADRGHRVLSAARAHRALSIARAHRVLSLLASVASLSLLAPIARHEPHASK